MSRKTVGDAVFLSVLNYVDGISGIMSSEPLIIAKRTLTERWKPSHPPIVVWHLYFEIKPIILCRGQTTGYFCLLKCSVCQIRQLKSHEFLLCPCYKIKHAILSAVRHSRCTVSCRPLWHTTWDETMDCGARYTLFFFPSQHPMSYRLGFYRVDIVYADLSITCSNLVMHIISLRLQQLEDCSGFYSGVRKKLPGKRLFISSISPDCKWNLLAVYDRSGSGKNNEKDKSCIMIL